MLRSPREDFFSTCTEVSVCGVPVFCLLKSTQANCRQMSFFSEAKFECVGEYQDIPAKTFLLACNEIIPFMGKGSRQYI